MILVDSNIQQERINICESCDNFKSQTKFCKLCMCFMPAKTWLANVSCADLKNPKWTKDIIKVESHINSFKEDINPILNEDVTFNHIEFIYEGSDFLVGTNGDLVSNCKIIDVENNELKNVNFTLLNNNLINANEFKTKAGNYIIINLTQKETNSNVNICYKVIEP